MNSAGDVNGDGFNDLAIIAANDTGYVVFGKASGFSSNVNLSGLDGETGFRLDNRSNNHNDDSRFLSVSSAGDINGDGFGDVMISGAGAPSSYELGYPIVYIVFGNAAGNDIYHLGSPKADLLDNQSPQAERFVSGDGNDTMIGGGGADVFYGGAGNDTIRVATLDFHLIDGGSGYDNLAVDGSSQNLVLADFRGKISGIEMINLAGRGDNTLTITALDLLNLSNNSNTLRVEGNGGDTIKIIGSNWIDNGIADGYHSYIQGAAVLQIGVNVTTDFV